MIALEIRVNGELVTTAGRDDSGVLDATIGALGVLGVRSRGTVPVPEGVELNLHVGGMSTPASGDDTFVRWAGRRDLRPGDEVSVRILETGRAGPPEEERAYPSDEEQDRMQWENARDHYLRHRHKYEA